MTLRTRHVCLAIVMMLLLATVLAACGGGDETPTNDPTPPPPAEATSAAESTAPADAATPGEVTGDPTPTASTGGTPATEPTVPAGATPPPTGTAAPTRESTTDYRDGDFAFGWNVAFRGDDNGVEHNERTIELVQDSGFGWVRFQLEWRQFQRQRGSWDPLPMDRVIEQANAAGLNILIVVAKAPDWALDSTGNEFLADYNEFTQFMAFVANRYRGKVQAYEIWNEQNLAHEMSGTVRVEDYYNLLRAGHIGVRLSDQDALIVFGGLTPNGVNDPGIAIDDLLYLEQIYAIRGGLISDYFDVMGVHLNSTHNPPDTMWPDNPSAQDGWNDHESFYFRRAEQLRQVMLAYGDEAPLWITEFGWTTENQAPGYEYGINNSEEDVAEYLARAIEIARTDWDFVTGAFVWNLNWSTLSTPEEEIHPWSAVNADWSPRPAYEAMRDLDKQ